MKIISNLIAVSFLVLSLTGCIVVGGGDGDGDWGYDNDHWKHQQKENKRVINHLEINDSRASILDQLGAPDFSEAFARGEDNFRILFYRTQHEHSDGETSKDETTPLVFKNDLLVGWGSKALHAVR